MKHLLTILFSFIICSSDAQVLFYQETFRGGTTGAGFSTALGYGSGSFNIYIEPGSTILKAWLFGQRLGYPQPITITLNGKNYTFDESLNIVHPNLSSYSQQCSPLAIDVLDITNDILPTTTTYFINIPTPNQNYTFPCWGYSAFYLIVLYENPTLLQHNSVILLNNKQIKTNTPYSVSNINPINTNYPVGFSIFSDRIDGPNDGVFCYFNSNLLGLIGGSDSVNYQWTGAGVKGHFYYQNNTLYGLDDDTPDSLMNGSDGLADVSSYLTNNVISFNFLMQYQIPNNHTNLYDAFFLTYTTPCDTFSTSAYAVQDTICYGDSVQLFASGGVQYSWFGAFGGLSDSAVANPMASPPQTTTYICTITNDSGCVKTQHVKVYVIPPVDCIKVKPTLCGEQTGKITAEFNSNYTFTLLDSNNQTVASNTTGIFSQLPQGTYILQSQNNQCTYYDTLTVGNVNQTVASFWRNPYQGKAPLAVEFGNQSQIATDFVWLFPNDTFYTPNLTYTFDTGGVYPVCLVAYNNYPHCSDTACYTFFVEENALLEVPNVFSPNGDGKNDFFTLQFFDAAGISAIQVDIFNRWGQTVHQFSWQNTPPVHLNVWDGTNANGEKLPEGTYFYTVIYTLNGKQLNQKGSVTLVR